MMRPQPANPGPGLVPPPAAPRAETPPPSVAPRIVSLDADHWRDDLPLGPIFLREWTIYGDDVQVSAKLDAPAYVYVIALNPDGKDMLCLPAHESKPPSLAREISFGELAFPLNDGSGQQAFVVLASRNPLPVYDDWKQGKEGKAVLGRWRPVAADNAPGVWEFNDGETQPPVARLAGPTGEASRLATRSLPGCLRCAQKAPRCLRGPGHRVPGQVQEGNWRRTP